jgi:hypothetical protein
MKPQREMDEAIRKIRTILKNALSKMDQTTNQRHRKLSSVDILYFLIHKVYSGTGYQVTLNHMLNKKLIDNVSYQAINKKIVNGHYSELFQGLCQTLIQKFLPHNRDHMSVCAVDGSQVKLPLSLKNKGYMNISQQPYTTGLVSTFYDVDNHVPICSQLECNRNERARFLQQASAIESQIGHMVLTTDRGYFSKHVIAKLLLKHQNFLARLPINSHWIKDLKEHGTDDACLPFNNSHVRIVHYQVENSEQHYYLITSLIDRLSYPLDLLKRWYHQRWDIEEYYKTFKRINIASTSEEGIFCEISVHQLITILNGCLLSLLNVKKNFKINQKVLMSSVVEDILPSIFYGQRLRTQIIIAILTNVEYCQIAIRLGRHYPREVRCHDTKFAIKHVHT